MPIGIKDFHNLKIRRLQGTPIVLLLLELLNVKYFKVEMHILYWPSA
jgi:hypothetical protein